MAVKGVNLVAASVSGPPVHRSAEDSADGAALVLPSSKSGSFRASIIARHNSRSRGRPRKSQKKP
jgi:hypothetical protein